MQAAAAAESEFKGSDKQEGSQAIVAIEENSQPMVPTMVKLVASVDEIIKQIKDFERLKTEIITSNPNNYHVYKTKDGEKGGITRSGWRRIQTFFGISDRIIYKERLTKPNPINPAVEIYGYEIHVEAYIPGIKSVIGIAQCWSNEPNKFFPHGEHDVFSTCHTRAKNRAVSDFAGTGELSAEEIEGADAERVFQTENKPAASTAAGSTPAPAGGKSTMDEFRSYGPAGVRQKT